MIIVSCMIFVDYTIMIIMIIISMITQISIIQLFENKTQLILWVIIMII